MFLLGFDIALLRQTIFKPTREELFPAIIALCWSSISTFQVDLALIVISVSRFQYWLASDLVHNHLLIHIVEIVRAFQIGGRVTVLRCTRLGALMEQWWRYLRPFCSHNCRCSCSCSCTCTMTTICCRRVAATLASCHHSKGLLDFLFLCKRRHPLKLLSRRLNDLILHRRCTRASVNGDILS